MAFACENCGKGTVSGRTQTHHRGVAGKRWKNRAQMTHRTFRPNLQRVTVMVAGVPVKMRLCASCLKRFKKDGRIQNRQTQTASI